MMTKDVWITIRNNQPLITTEVYFEYYRELGGKVDTIEEFVLVFNHLSNGAIVLGGDGRMKRITAKSAYTRLHEYYDNKFGL